MLLLLLLYGLYNMNLLTLLGNYAFTPTKISNLSLWLDAADTATITHSGGAVSQWNDKSGLGNHVTQGTAGSKPITGTRTINGKNVLDFDGTDDALILPSGLYSIPTSNNTVFAVTLLDSTAASANVICMSDAGTGRWRLLPVDITNVNISGGNSSSNTVVSALVTSLSTVNARASFLARSGGAVVVGTDGTLGTAAVASNMTATIGRIGTFTSGTQPLNGVIAEILVYSKSLTNSEINQVGNYLKAKWGVAWTNLPTVPSSLIGQATMVGFGDSIIFGQGATTTSQQWLQIIGSSLRVITTNQGIAGTVLQNSNDNGGAPRANNGRDRYVTALTGAARKDICIIAYGLNDLRYQALPSDFSRANFKNDYQEIITGLLADGYAANKIVLCTPYYMTTTGYSTGTSGFTGANATINLDYGAAVRELAVTNGTLFADVYAYMAANGGDSLIGGDNIHPNDTGHAAIAASVLTATTVS